MSDKKVKVTLVKSLAGRPARHRVSAKALGLHRMQQSMVLNDTAPVRGLINQLNYLLKVESA
jgi:large subunit ribosomal protein L30